MAEQQPERIDFEDELRRYARREPFVPFDIVTASGDSYEVRDTLEIAMGHTAVIVVLPKTGIRVIRLDDITAVHVHEPV